MGLLSKCIFAITTHHTSMCSLGKDEAIISINTLGVIEGKLPPRIMGMVSEWASMHQDELLADWEKSKNLEPLEKIAPLP
ncbi:hypothetical protein C1752_02178 [Acaryochloris thomasi RCC1774]|uniref:Transcriptional regulator n=1 Tax=Acaryochloris thomasi RCC1774 TaxID=1764569 RepID=A0A2W1JJF2_9CYAN|nr:hypothetical protein C1752_02178 [Acaryochloris thomasi RCC1774]